MKVGARGTVRLYDSCLAFGAPRAANWRRLGGLFGATAPERWKLRHTGRVRQLLLPRPAGHDKPVALDPAGRGAIARRALRATVALHQLSFGHILQLKKNTHKLQDSFYRTQFWRNKCFLHKPIEFAEQFQSKYKINVCSDYITSLSKLFMKKENQSDSI